uniref:Transposase (putative) gypsy type domain-containing protein n=1 Tax=Oryza brachyantha TaxID=4533 RepID=J3N6Y1_ORYBR
MAASNDSAKELPLASWQTSNTRDKELKNMVNAKLLLDQPLTCWRSAASEPLPTPNSNEIIVFASFFERGFSLPVSSFSHSLLDFYKLELNHLNPNFILQIYVFVYICESFLGIPPYFNLFHHLFMVRPQPSRLEPSIVRGGCRYSATQGMQEGVVHPSYMFLTEYVHAECSCLIHLHGFHVAKPSSDEPIAKRHASNPDIEPEATEFLEDTRVPSPPSSDMGLTRSIPRASAVQLLTSSEPNEPPTGGGADRTPQVISWI